MDSEWNHFSKYLQGVQSGQEHLEGPERLGDPKRESSYHKICYIIGNKAF